MCQPNFKVTFEAFERLVVDLNVEWQMFEDLFSQPTNWDLLNDSAPTFFRHLQLALLDLLFFSISRFFDPARNGHYENLSLEQIINFEEVAFLRHDLTGRLNATRTVWERGICVWRNKRLAHNDLSTALGAQALPHIPTNDIKHLVVAISEFARAINHGLYQLDVKYEVAFSDWVPSLLMSLRSGQKGS